MTDLVTQARNVAAAGRNGDSVLVHMTPDEVADINRLGIAAGYGPVGINPETGQPEAFSLGGLFKGIASALPGVLGTAFLGPLGGALAQGLFTGLKEDNLKKGILAGLGTYMGGRALDKAVGAVSGASGGGGASNVMQAMGPDGISVATNLAPTNAISAAASDPGFFGSGIEWMKKVPGALMDEQGRRAAGESFFEGRAPMFILPAMAEVNNSIQQDERAKQGAGQDYAAQVRAAREQWQERFGGNGNPYANFYASRVMIPQRYAEGGMVTDDFRRDLMDEGEQGEYYVPPGEMDLRDFTFETNALGLQGRYDDVAHIYDKFSASDREAMGQDIIMGMDDTPEDLGFMENVADIIKERHGSDDVDMMRDVLKDGFWDAMTQRGDYAPMDERNTGPIGGGNPGPGGMFGNMQGFVPPEGFTPGYHPEFIYVGNQPGPNPMEYANPRGANPFTFNPMEEATPFRQPNPYMGQFSGGYGGGGIVRGVSGHGGSRSPHSFLPSQSPALFSQGGMIPNPRGGLGDGIAAQIGSIGELGEPAALSPGEFVIPADVVAALGDGDTEAGGDILEQMNQRIRMQKYGTPAQLPPVDLSNLPG